MLNSRNEIRYPLEGTVKLPTATMSVWCICNHSGSLPTCHYVGYQNHEETSVSTAKQQGPELTPLPESKVCFWAQKGYVDPIDCFGDGGHQLQMGKCIKLERRAFSVINTTNLTIQCYKHARPDPHHPHPQYPCASQYRMEDVQPGELKEDLTPGVEAFYIEAPVVK